MSTTHSTLRLQSMNDDILLYIAKKGDILVTGKMRQVGRSFRLLLGKHTPDELNYMTSRFIHQLPRPKSIRIDQIHSSNSYIMLPDLSQSAGLSGYNLQCFRTQHPTFPWSEVSDWSFGKCVGRPFTVQELWLVSKWIMTNLGGWDGLLCRVERAAQQKYHEEKQKLEKEMAEHQRQYNKTIKEWMKVWQAEEQRPNKFTLPLKKKVKIQAKEPPKKNAKKQAKK